MEGGHVSPDVESAQRRDNVTIEEPVVRSENTWFKRLFTWFCTCFGRGVPGAAANTPLLNPTTAEVAVVPSLRRRIANWITVLLCGSVIDYGDGTQVVRSFDGLFGGYEALPPPTAASSPTESVPLSTVVPPVAVWVMDWSGFFNDAHGLIRWKLQAVLLFVPAKILALLALLFAGWSSESFSRFADDAQKNFFPRLFVSSILVYGGCHMAAKIYKSPTLRFVYEVLSMFAGLGATVLVLVYIGPEEWGWVTGTVITLCSAIGLCKIWDNYH